MPGSGSIGRHWGCGCDTPVEFAANHWAPFAVLEHDLQDAGAVSRHLHRHMRLRHRGEIVAIRPDIDTRKHHFRTGVLVVDAEQAACPGIVERKEGQVVVVVAEPLALVLACQRPRIEGAAALEKRIAPTDENVGLIAVRHMMGLIDTACDLAEAEGSDGRMGARAAAGERCRTEQSGGRRHSERAFEHVATAETAGNDRADRIVRDGRQRHIVESLERFGLVGELIVVHRHTPGLTPAANTGLARKCNIPMTAKSLQTDGAARNPQCRADFFRVFNGAAERN